MTQPASQPGRQAGWPAKNKIVHSLAVYIQTENQNMETIATMVLVQIYQ